jgi:hypothetical protein
MLWGCLLVVDPILPSHIPSFVQVSFGFTAGDEVPGEDIWIEVRPVFSQVFEHFDRWFEVVGDLLGLGVSIFFIVIGIVRFSGLNSLFSGLNTVVKHLEAVFVAASLGDFDETLGLEDLHSLAYPAF